MEASRDLGFDEGLLRDAGFVTAFTTLGEKDLSLLIELRHSLASVV